MKINTIVFYLTGIYLLIGTPICGQILQKGVKTTTKVLSNQAWKNLPRLERNAYVYNAGLRSSLPKRILNKRFLYEEEVWKATQLYKKIESISLQNADLSIVRQDIDQVVVNKTLRTNLHNSLKQRSRVTLLNTLSDYYHLAPKYLPTFMSTITPTESFARETLDYLRHNPHKPNWALRHILKTEKVDPSLKNEIKYWIQQDVIPLEKNDYVLDLLRRIYTQYNEVLAAATIDFSIQETLSIYKQLADELEVFTAQYNRAPMWNGDKSERDLLNWINVLVYHNQNNQFELIIPYFEKIYELLERFPTPCLDEKSDLDAIVKFFEKYNSLPRSVRLRDFLHMQPDEPLLYNALLYWQQKSPHFRRTIENLVVSKQKGFYPPYF